MTEEPSCRARNRATLAQLGLALTALTALTAITLAAGWGLGYDHHRNHARRPCQEGL